MEQKTLLFYFKISHGQLREMFGNFVIQIEINPEEASILFRKYKKFQEGHFKLEEKIFKKYKNLFNRGLVARLRNQHERIAETIKEITKLFYGKLSNLKEVDFEVGADLISLKRKLINLKNSMKEHVYFEERDFYFVLQKKLDKDDRIRLIKEIKKN